MTSFRMLFVLALATSLVVVVSTVAVQAVQPTTAPTTAVPTAIAPTTIAPTTIAPTTQSAICSTYAVGDYTSCYAARATCRFDMQTDTCVSGAPKTCAEYGYDGTGCVANALCITATSGVCINAPPSCALLLTTTACTTRTDCKWYKSACISVSASGVGITNVCVVTSAIACYSARCFWDVYLGQCFLSLSEISAYNNCSSWSNNALPLTACIFHQCALDTAQTTCLTPGSSAANTTNTSTSSLTAAFRNPVLSVDQLTFSVQVWLPNQLVLNPAAQSFITVGGGVASYGAPGLIVPSVCNNLAAFSYSQPPPAYLSVSDPVGLQAYFEQWVSKQNTFTFPSTTANGQLLYSILGNQSIGRNTGFDTSVALDSTGYWVVHNISFNLNDVVASCIRLGAYETFYGSYRYYTIPIAVIQRSPYNAFTQTSTTFYIQIGSTGTVANVTTSSRYQPILRRNEITPLTSNCPAGQALLNTAYMLEVANVYTPGIYVGPRTVADVSFTSPQFGNTLQNCYGETATYLAFQGCSGSSCYTSLTTQTRCRLVTPDGEAYNNCSYALAADRAADVGVGNAYPASLDGIHSFYVNNYQCPLSASASNNFTGCTLAVQSPSNYPDLLTSSIRLSVYPTSLTAQNFDVYSGILPTPFTTDLTQLQTLSQGPNSPALSRSDLFNAQLQWNGIFTFVIGILDPSLRAVSNLTMSINAGFLVYPTDINGQTVANGASLSISQLLPYMMYVPKQALALCAASTHCANAPATANQPGYDSFAISVRALRSLLPANGYTVSISYVISAPHSTGANALGSTSSTPPPRLYSSSLHVLRTTTNVTELTATHVAHISVQQRPV